MWIQYNGPCQFGPLQGSILTKFLSSVMDQVKLVHYFVYFLWKTQLYYSGPNSLVSVFANPSNSYYYLT